MKQHIVRILHAACLCLAVSLPSAFAQASQAITVDVPFAFQVNNKQFPAGKYHLTAGAGQPALLIRGVDTKQSMFGLTSPIDSKQIREYPTLVFSRYGDRYFLSQIWAAGSTTGRGLTAGAAEREVAQRWAKSASTSGTEVLAVLALPDVGK
ncbi:MAG: hypothetical protein ABSC05_15395 [Candidatus Solibacter sp.]|jgi:predicted secreted protein